MWVQMWPLEEMFAGVPGRGAVDAWHEVLTTLEECKLEDNSYCGRVADIAKFFDQIKRAMLYIRSLRQQECQQGFEPPTRLTWKTCSFTTCLPGV